MMEDLNICQKPTKYGQSMFCEAVKVDMENSKKSSFHHTITSTLSLITVLFEDIFETITLHRKFSGEKVRLEPWTLLLKAKHGHHILHSSLDWTNQNKGSLHQTFSELPH